MPEKETTTRRRARRPTEAVARLERVRRRNAEQLEAQREAERRIETALKAYVDAEVSIHAVEHDRDDKLAILEGPGLPRLRPTANSVGSVGSGRELL
jgi:mannose-6-phosphate isomerase-like protein (cupin superfamily)